MSNVMFINSVFHFNYEKVCESLVNELMLINLIVNIIYTNIIKKTIYRCTQRLLDI